jgi:leucyl-tRNA synthetase
MDAYSRKKRMENYNVLYPMGWDAFGLPAENYAIKTGIHPSITVPKNIDRFRKQCKSLGLSFDWDREINTTDPDYYKWTQWIFIQLFKNGLAYRSGVYVNWCPFCKTNLADEEVLADGKHERCGNLTEKRIQNQWLLRITEYADRLLTDLDTIDYSEKIKLQQINWIGKKRWVDIEYQIEGESKKIVVSTTRPETNYGATFMVIAPEHPLLIKENIPELNWKDIERYIEKSKSKSEIERISEERKKTGVFTGLYAINPLNNYKMPIWVADFVLMNVGTGAVVGVPGHDRRDFEFAKEFGLSIKRVVIGKDEDASEITEINQIQEGEGVVVNSEIINGLKTDEAINKIIDYLEEKGWGKRIDRYHIHDWVFSRQHYWGEPIPMIYCEKCAKEGKSWFTSKGASFKGIYKNRNDWNPDGWYPLSDDQLPLELPFIKKYQPSGTGESPLANEKKWLKVTCPECKGEARRETDTMPNWAGSNWYFIRYIDPKYDKGLADFDKMKYWLPVDMYQGGFEHTTLHLLYSRFIYKFLHDIGVVPTNEPYAKRRSHGIVLGADARKMSKSFGNVINPDEIVEKYGADTLRMYEMFMGPFDQTITWSEESLEGCFRFLNRLWRVFNEKVGGNTEISLKVKLNQTIKKVDQDLEDLKFNTAVASMMELLNYWEAQGNLDMEDAVKFVGILAPFAPHLTEEIWHSVLGFKTSVHISNWPKYNPEMIIEKTLIIAVQINGKLRGTLEIENQESKIKSQVEKMAKEDLKIQKWLEGKEIRKVIFVEGKLINFVI